MSMIYFVLLVTISAFASINERIHTYIREGASSLDQVVERLPEDLRKNFTFVYDGRALLKTSYENPAAILFGKDGKTLLAFNAHQSSLDILEFDEIKKEYIPTRFLFSPTKAELLTAKSAIEIAPKIYFEPKPTLCMNCHGATHHPIFETGYPTWKGFYGSDRDHLYQTDKAEIEGYKKFLATKDLNPRYRALMFPPASSMSPYLDSETERSMSYAEAHTYRPNLMFDSYITRINALTVFKELQKSKYYEKYKKLLADALERCPLNDIPDEIEQLPSQYKLNSSSFNRNELNINRVVAGKLIALMGVTPDLWNLSLKGNDYGHWSGYGDTLEFVHASIVQDIFKDETLSIYKETSEIFGKFTKLHPRYTAITPCFSTSGEALR